MPREATRFAVIAAAFIVVLFIIPLVGYQAHDYVGYVIFLEFVVLLPLLVVTARDALHALNSVPGGSPIARRVIRILASAPAFAFGLLSLACGVAIIGWVLYNLLIERQYQFTGSVFAGFGIGPVLVLFGLGSLVSVFRRQSKSESPTERIEDEET